MKRLAIVLRVTAVVTLLGTGALATSAEIHGWKLVPVNSVSMNPTLAAGSAMIMHSVNASTVKPGDIIGYVSPLPGRPVVIHRVVSITHDGGQTLVTTKGDANKGVDPWMTDISVQRSMTSEITLPYGGIVLHLLQALGPIRIVLIGGIIALSWTFVRLIWRTPAAASIAV